MSDEPFVNFKCHSCGKEIRALVEQSGKKGRCKHCRAVATVPMPVGPCWNCGNRILIVPEELPDENDTAAGIIFCGGCNAEHHYITYKGQKTVRMGTPDEMKPEIDQLRRHVEFVEEQAVMMQQVLPRLTPQQRTTLANAGPVVEPAREPSGARNQRQAYCYYCQCALPKGTGYMHDVPSHRGRPMRRTVCRACYDRPTQDWTLLQRWNDGSTFVVVLVIVAFVLVAIVGAMSGAK